MAENSGIEWTTHTFNPWRGCTKVSDGCANCYAETMSHRNPKTLGIWGPNGTRVVASEAMWREPLKWNKQAGEYFKNWERAALTCRSEYDTPDPYERPRVFCASLADVFEGYDTMPRDSRVAVAEARTRLMRLIIATPNLDWLLLTKRPQNVAAIQAEIACDLDTYEAEEAASACANRVWLGVSVENQATADERIPHLLRVPAKVRFLSMEPLLGPVDLSRWIDPVDKIWNRQLHWVIVGGESGHGARPMHPDWVRSIRDQCQTARVPFFFKQWGEWSVAEEFAGPVAVSGSLSRLRPIGIDGQVAQTGNAPYSLMNRVGKKIAGRMLDGEEWNEFPEVPGR